MFEQAMKMFLPFTGGRERGAPPQAGKEAPAAKPDTDLDAMRRQLEEMQRRLDRMSEKK